MFRTASEGPMRDWQAGSACESMDTNFFFDLYDGTEPLDKEAPDEKMTEEERKEDLFSFRHVIDDTCLSCPIRKTCFARGVSSKEWGVWGGVYLKDGKIDKDANSHKSRSDWANVWESLTMETP